MIIKHGNVQEWKELMKATGSIFAKKYGLIFAGISRIDGYPLVVNQSCDVHLIEYQEIEFDKIKKGKDLDLANDLAYKDIISKEEAKRLLLNKKLKKVNGFK